jgi:neutral ceramidase
MKGIIKMKIAFTRMVIDPQQPVRQAGFSQQVNPVSLVHDHLYARLVGIDDGQKKAFLVSIDSIGLPPQMAADLYQWAKDKYGNDTFTVTSATHTHFAGDPRNETYAAQLVNQLHQLFEQLTWQEYGEVTVSHQHVYFDGVGRSRISSSPTHNIFLDAVTLWNKEHRIGSLIVHNCHPTIQNGDTTWFSGEYPGYVLNQLGQAYPEEFFTFMQGADGDISTRFTRPFQNYDAVMILGDRLKDEIITLRNQPVEKQAVTISSKTEILPLEHEFDPIDMSRMPQNLSPREKETILIGQQEREKLSHHLDRLQAQITISCLDLQGVRFIFVPNELFSSFINCINLQKSILVCYSNGYAPYVTDPDFSGLTYEIFTDTLTRKTKDKYKALLADLGN